jgi:ATP-grasp domain
MFLIDSPFASDFLISTIRENEYKIIDTEAARKLVKDDALSWISEEDAVSYIRNNPDTPLYSNSENALAWVAEQLADSSFAINAQLFKDKVKFRELVRASYPEFFFMTVTLEDIQSLNPKELPFPFVIKPSVGFFSIGVHVVRNEDDWQLARKELQIEKLQSAYPTHVLSTSSFIIEEFIEGEEFAIDCYFNQKGEVVILNILHHKFSSGADTSDRVYSTSKEIVLRHKHDFEVFLQSLGHLAGLKNFPAHVELRIDEKGRIKPIEINPLRFGGLCTTADLLGIATGTNPYEYYHENKKPDWEKVFEGRNDNKISIVVLNNNSGYSPDQIEYFDYDLLEKDFENALTIRKFDVKNYSAFGFVFAETSPGNEAELNKILASDLRKYIRVKALQ